MSVNKNLIIDKLIEVDDSGMPIAPKVQQLIDKDVRTLYMRDKTPDKKQYIAECIVIYYLGDPKSPAKQAGLSDSEALQMAIEQAGLDKSYIPDIVVLNLIKKYYEQNIGEAGRVVENILKSLHNTNLTINIINDQLNQQLRSGATIDQISSLTQMVKEIKNIASEMPSTLKKLQEAKENLMYEKETELSRGGNKVLSSMDAEDY